MSEYARRLSALAEAYREGRSGAAGERPGISLAERRPLDMAQVAAFQGRAKVVCEAVERSLGLALPSRPNTASSSAGRTALWVGPDRWLLVTAASGGDGLARTLRQDIAVDAAAVIDLSQGRTAIRVSGERCHDLLAKGTGIDLDRRIFLPGACAQTLLGHIGALLHAVEPAAIDVYVARSYALTFWEWLTEAAGEYGYQVNPAAR